MRRCVLETFKILQTSESKFDKEVKLNAVTRYNQQNYIHITVGQSETIVSE